MMVAHDVGASGPATFALNDDDRFKRLPVPVDDTRQELPERSVLFLCSED
jgi:hypothetical protein